MSCQNQTTEGLQVVSSRGIPGTPTKLLYGFGSHHLKAPATLDQGWHDWGCLCMLRIQRDPATENQHMMVGAGSLLRGRDCKPIMVQATWYNDEPIVVHITHITTVVVTNCCTSIAQNMVHVNIHIICIPYVNFRQILEYEEYDQSIMAK